METPANATIFSLIKSRMTMLGERQKVIAENVANVSTPRFTPQDVDAARFQKALERSVAANGAPSPGAPQTTHARHISTMSSNPAVARATLTEAPDSETTIDGNSVVVEEQMMKLAETRMDFETMVGLYQKSMALMRIARKDPGT